MPIKNIFRIFIFVNLILIFYNRLGLADDLNASLTVNQEINSVSPPAADLLSEKSVQTNDSLNKLCAETYLKEATCPKDHCKLFCLEGDTSQKCTLTCEPRPCVELSIEYCPKDSCQILEGCGDHTRRCYPKLVEEPSDCGTLSYAGNLNCCQGLVKRCGVEYFDGSCDMSADFSVHGVPQCIPCGNGICNQFENRCNCPEDCTN